MTGSRGGAGRPGEPREAADELAGRREPYADARERLVREHIVPAGVRDSRVLAAMRKVPRHRFVEEEHRERAYEDRPLPIARGQVVTQPSLVAQMVEAASVAAHERVLEIGTGSGYGAAVLSQVADSVYSVERHGAMAEAARRRLEELGYGNVRIFHGDGSKGLARHGPYASIVVTAGAPSLPPAYSDQLGEGGRIVIPLGSRPTAQTLVRLVEEDGMLTREELMGVRFVPLVGEEGWNREELPSPAGGGAR